nr:hypothetical protein 11 [Bacillaceae bacterium]
MDTQQYNGQILGTYNGEPLYVQLDANGKLLMSSLPSGTNNIGDVDVLTLPSIPSGVNDIGQVLNGFKNDTVLPSLARTTSGNSVEFDVSKYKEAIVFLDVTTASGTSPTLDVKFQTQDPASLKWFDITGLTFAQKTAVGNEVKEKSNVLGSKIRCTYTIGGTTPSFTFSVGLVLKS